MCHRVLFRVLCAFLFVWYKKTWASLLNEKNQSCGVLQGLLLRYKINKDYYLCCQRFSEVLLKVLKLQRSAICVN